MFICFDRIHERDGRQTDRHRVTTYVALHSVARQKRSHNDKRHQQLDIFTERTLVRYINCRLHASYSWSMYIVMTRSVCVSVRLSARYLKRVDGSRVAHAYHVWSTSVSTKFGRLEVVKFSC